MPVDIHSNRRAQAAWNRKAVGSQRAKAEAGSAEYYDQIRAYRYGYETPFIPEIFEFARMGGQRVLEIGIGNGIDAVEMMRNGAIYTGLDITENHLALTKRFIEIANLGPQTETIIEGDLLEKNLPGTYDVIYSFGVLHHIAHEDEYLRKMKSLLKPGGELRVAVYSKYSFFNAYLAATWLVKNRMHNRFDDWRSHLSEGSVIGNPVTIKIRSRRVVQRMLEQAGFSVVRYQKRGFVQNYIPLVGRKLSPNGAVLTMFGSVLGWYHCFICR